MIKASQMFYFVYCQMTTLFIQNDRVSCGHTVRDRPRLFDQVGHQTTNPRPIERRLDSVFHKTEMKIWAGQNFLAAHIV